MTVEDCIQQIRRRYDGFNDPVDGGDWARLEKVVGSLPPDIRKIYRDHDGSTELPRRGDRSLTARLLPAEEAIETYEMIQYNLDTVPIPSTGRIAWLWTDDESNYVGLYTDGPLRGYLTKLDHEDPCLAPAYRNAASFLSRILEYAPGASAGKNHALDLPTTPRELPLIEEDEDHLDADRALSDEFRRLYESETQQELRGLYAACAICLTPVSLTATVVPFLSAKDMWIPDDAVTLMELRDYGEAVTELEQLAIEGFRNGDAAAMRALVRLDTQPSRAAVARLQQTLPASKLDTLQLWVKRSDRMLPPQWH